MARGSGVGHMGGCYFDDNERIVCFVSRTEGATVTSRRRFGLIIFGRIIYLGRLGYFPIADSCAFMYSTLVSAILYAAAQDNQLLFRGGVDGLQSIGASLPPPTVILYECG